LKEGTRLLRSRSRSSPSQSVGSQAKTPRRVEEKKSTSTQDQDYNVSLQIYNSLRSSILFLFLLQSKLCRLALRIPSHLLENKHLLRPELLPQDRTFHSPPQSLASSTHQARDPTKTNSLDVAVRAKTESDPFETGEGVEERGKGFGILRSWQKVRDSQSK